MFDRLPDRFWEKVQFEPNSGCWIWEGSINHKGYAYFWFNGKTCRAHKVTYLTFVGEIKDGLQLDHLCRMRCCVNPYHLEAVTSSENARRGNTGMHNKMKTECVRGHKFSSENTYISPRGGRQCRTCMRMRDKAFRGQK